MHHAKPALAMLAVLAALPGCASSRPAERPGASPAPASLSQGCANPTCAPEIMRVAHGTEVPIEKHAPPVAAHPLTSVVVTQCNLIVAVYLTMPDGQLLRLITRPLSAPSSSWQWRTRQRAVSASKCPAMTVAWQGTRGTHRLDQAGSRPASATEARWSRNTSGASFAASTLGRSCGCEARAMACVMS